MTDLIPIPHSGAKPAWLTAAEYESFFQWKREDYSGEHREWLEAFLPPTHWASAPLRAGMTPWSWRLQGHAAPKDWNRDARVMLENGSLTSATLFKVWSSQIIGYEPIATETPSRDPQRLPDTQASDSGLVEVWGYGWFENGGKKMAHGYLPTVDYPRPENVSEGPFPLYREPPSAADRIATLEKALASMWKPIETASSELSVGGRTAMILGIDADGNVHKTSRAPDHAKGGDWLISSGEGLMAWTPILWCELPEQFQDRNGQSYEVRRRLSRIGDRS